jgi:alpha-L-rhamnosidase
MSTLTPIALRCEYLTDPLAIERPDPRLSWYSTSASRNARQTAYRVTVAGSAAELMAGKLLWDSGKVASDASAHIHYAGAPLASFQRAFWRVQVWDELDRPSDWSATAQWAMGIRERGSWKAEWIHTPLFATTNCPYFRRSFQVTSPVVDARLYATARGVCRAWINGQLVSDEQLAPGWTDYDKRILYRCHDVTKLLGNSGEQVLGAQIADGWHKGALGWTGNSSCWGNAVKLLMRLRLVHADGTVTDIGSDGQWRTANSPILASSFQRGEHYDAGLEPVGWNLPGFDDSAWHRSHTLALDDLTRLQAHPGPAVRPLREYQATRAWESRPGVWIFDLGQNIAGHARIRANVPAGTTLRIRHGEMVTPDQRLYVDNLRGALSTDFFTAAGGKDEIWEPAFTFHGFQYVELSGWPGEPPLDAVCGILISSACPAAGSFSCSEPMLNRLYSNIVHTQLANYIDVPTDCPQRDERLGWTGDAQAYIRTAICSFDVASFFTKWHQDLRDAQFPDGCFPNFAPNVPGMYPKDPNWNKGDAAWGDAGTICPMTIYQCYADRDQLAASYPSMLKWVDYLAGTMGRNLYVRYEASGPKPWMVGDWLNVDVDTAHEIIMTAFVAHSARLTAQAAAILGKTDDAKRLDDFHAKVRNAFIREFVQSDGRVIGKTRIEETQTAYLLALHFDLVPNEKRAAVFEHLIASLAKADWHLTSGFVGLPYLMPVLSANGRADVAFRLLTNTTYPSWLYPITQGATTIWERWNGWKKDVGPADPSMNSYSHYAYGAVGEWLFSDIAGIDLIETGFKRIRIRPRLGGTLTKAEATHTCLYGPIRSAWEIQGVTLSLKVEIPANTTAQVHIPTQDQGSIREGGKPWTGTMAAGEPGYVVLELGSGSYAFSAKAVALTKATSTA